MIKRKYFSFSIIIHCNSTWVLPKAWEMTAPSAVLVDLPVVGAHFYSVHGKLAQEKLLHKNLEMGK